MIRQHNRPPDAMRPVTLQRGFTRHAEGSVLIQIGDTHVLCNASIEEKVPPFLRSSGRGWVTAEYAMLPRATHERTVRESARGRQSGRTLEIQRLIGRSLRAAVDLELLGKRTITIDCDVIQADGGTRTAAITGGYVALADAVNGLVACGALRESPLRRAVASVSVGLLNGQALTDLEYIEDSQAETDMNIVMDDSGRFIEVQGTAEGRPFAKVELDEMLSYGSAACAKLFGIQRRALEEPLA